MCLTQHILRGSPRPHPPSQSLLPPSMQVKVESGVGVGAELVLRLISWWGRRVGVEVVRGRWHPRTLVKKLASLSL